MRLLVQIAAVIAFVLAGSQFSLGHEPTAHGMSHVHEYSAASSGYQDDRTAQSGGDTIVHCGAQLLPLNSDTSLAISSNGQAFDPALPLDRKIIHAAIDLPPPRV